jgi:hypothetical protein
MDRVKELRITLFLSMTKAIYTHIADDKELAYIELLNKK